MYFLSSLASFLNSLIITNLVVNRLKNRCIDENLFFCILRSNVKPNSMLVGREAFLRYTLTPLQLKNISKISAMIPKIYDLIKRLNIEINPCLLKNFAKLGFLIFSAA